MVLSDELNKYFELVKPWDFYHEIFRDGELDEADAFTKGKYTAIAIEVINPDSDSDDGIKTVHRHTITDDLDGIDLLLHSDNFCIMAPISYAGKSRKSENARVMYALCVELDALKVEERGAEEPAFQKGLYSLFTQWKNEILPIPTFCVSSGSGLHLYYVFDKPIVLLPYVVKGLTKYKRQLTKRLWNREITYCYKEEHIQYESIFQAFRMPGTITKHGERAEAFRTGNYVSIDYMNSFIPASYRKKGAEIPAAYKTELPLAKAKELYPEWYDRRIVQGIKERKKWDIAGKVHGDNPYALYDWWYNKILDGALVGKRYYCLLMLVVYAIKCDVDEERVRKDCYTLLEQFDKLKYNPSRYAEDRKKIKKDNENDFTAFDVECALQAYYDAGLYTYPLNSIIYKSGIQIEKNKRNGRKQAEHLEEARALRDIRMRRKGRKWDDNNGRPKGSGTAQKKVLEWREANPNGKKAACVRDTGLDKKTVYKWWETELEAETPNKDGEVLCVDDGEALYRQFISFFDFDVSE